MLGLRASLLGMRPRLLALGAGAAARTALTATPASTRAIHSATRLRAAHVRVTLPGLTCAAPAPSRLLSSSARRVQAPHVDRPSLATAASGAAPAAPSATAIRVTAQNFPDLIRKEGVLSFLLCRDSSPASSTTLSSLGAALAGKAKVQLLDLHCDEVPQLCEMFRIPNYPAVLVVSNGGKAMVDNTLGALRPADAAAFVARALAAAGAGSAGGAGGAGAGAGAGAPDPTTMATLDLARLGADMLLAAIDGRAAAQTAQAFELLKAVTERPQPQEPPAEERGGGRLARYRKEKNDHDQATALALAGLARHALLDNRVADAKTFASAVQTNYKECINVDQRIVRMLAVVGLRVMTEDAGVSVLSADKLTELRAKATANAKDVETRKSLALALCAQGALDEAVGYALEMVRADRKGGDGVRLISAILDAVGQESDFARKTRKRLNNIVNV